MYHHMLHTNHVSIKRSIYAICQHKSSGFGDASDVVAVDPHESTALLRFTILSLEPDTIRVAFITVDVIDKRLDVNWNPIEVIDLLELSLESGCAWLASPEDVLEFEPEFLPHLTTQSLPERFIRMNLPDRKSEHVMFEVEQLYDDRLCLRR